MDELFFKLFDLSPDAVVVTDLESGTIFHINTAFCKIGGFSKEEVIGKTVFDISSWQNEEERVIWKHNLIAKREVEYDASFNTRINGVRHGNMRSKIIEIAGKECVISIVRDITEQKKIEDQLKASEETLKQAVMNMPIMLVAFNDKQELLVWNKECEAVTGYTMEEMVLNKNAISLLFPDPTLQRFIFQKLDNHSLQVQLKEYDFELVCKNGSIRYIHYRFNHIENPITGWDVWGIGTDVTEKIKAEKALEFSEKKFKYIATATNDALWDWDLVSNRIWWSEGMANLFGYTEKDTGYDISWWDEHIYPADMERVSAKIRQAIDRGDTYWSDEYRFIKKDGSIAMVYDKGLIIKDSKGKPIRMVGGMVDMTEMKKAQETISLQSKKLEEHSFVISHKIRSALSRILGLSSLYEYDLSKDELININNHLVSSSKELDLIIKELAHKIQEDNR